LVHEPTWSIYPTVWPSVSLYGCTHWLLCCVVGEWKEM